jgi:C4-dicarboxylate-specific signal transduction histidine kinase
MNLVAQLCRRHGLQTIDFRADVHNAISELLALADKWRRVKEQVLLNLILNGIGAMRGVTERKRELRASSDSRRAR